MDEIFVIFLKWSYINVKASDFIDFFGNFFFLKFLDQKRPEWAKN